MQRTFKYTFTLVIQLIFIEEKSYDIIRVKELLHAGTQSPKTPQRADSQWDKSLEYFEFIRPFVFTNHYNAAEE